MHNDNLKDHPSSHKNSKNSDIVLTTLNARYTHASLGLRYLRANLGDLRDASVIDELVTGGKATEMVEKLLAHSPRIIGFGVYIWNVDETTKIVGLIKRLAPHITIIIGGPEVSFEQSEQRICTLADYIISGWGDVTFATLCRAVLYGPKPIMKLHVGVQPPLSDIVMPYDEYTDEDIRNRTIYVEASRGCPFKCEFCLSALDKTAWAFDTDLFLGELAKLYDRGLRQFKFVDRTFNLNIKTSLRILQFFLDRLTPDKIANDPCFAHFEVVPDHLPDALRDTIQKFPAGALQFEIGIQTFNPVVQQLVSRKQDNDKAAANIAWLVQSSPAHLHVDLIAGLPDESLDSFAVGFNRLWALRPHEIQFGILKRLRGTPIIRHTEPFGLIFSPDAPYEILANHAIPFADMQRMVRFARYWDLVANSGRFSATLDLVLGKDAFARFMNLSDWLYATTQKTHQIQLERLFDLVYAWLTTTQGEDAEHCQTILVQDYAAIGAKGKLSFMSKGLTFVPKELRNKNPAEQAGVSALPERQAAHLKR